MRWMLACNYYPLDSPFCLLCFCAYTRRIPRGGGATQFAVEHWIVLVTANDKLTAMRKVHLVVCDLFLPRDIAAGVCADLRLPALGKMLAHGASTKPLVLSAAEWSARTRESASLEELLCEMFGVPCQPDVPIAPVSAAFDGLGLWPIAGSADLNKFAFKTGWGDTASHL